MTVTEALSRLLAGTGLVARQVGRTAWRIERASIAPVPSRPANDGAAPQQVVEAEPIVVTASKRTARLDALPMAVSVVSLGPMAAATTSSGTALVASESDGLSMTTLGPGRNRLFLRGVADSPFNGESQSTVAVVLDDARLTYAAPDPDLRLVDVERVEVLKGPQGSLYGSGALGGIYHVVTRRARVDDASLSVSSGAENVAHGGLGWNASAVGNLPVIPGTAALRLVGYSAKEAGWIDTGPRKDSNQTRLLGGRFNLGIEPGGGWRADIGGLAQLLESRDSRYVYARGARSRQAQLPEPHDNDMRHLSARLAREGTGIDITLSTAMTWHEVGDKLDATRGAEAFGLADPSLLSDERNFRVWDSEARVAGQLGATRWLVGLSHVDARQDSRVELRSFSTSPQLLDQDRRDTHETALFGDFSIPLGAKFSMEGGARLFRSQVIETRQLANGPVSRRRSRSGMTPSLSLSWRPSPRQIVYLRYASAWRQGGSDIGPNGELDRLRSDELQTIEAGWRRDLPGGGRLDLGIYASRWKDLQSDQLLANGLIESANAGDARIIGAEVSLDLPLTDAVGLVAGANFTDALLTRNMTGLALDDRRLPVVPRFTLRSALAWKFAVGGSDVMLRASLRYVGPQRLSFDPAIDRPMGSYLDTRMEAQASLGSFRAAIVAENLFGAAADSFAFGNSLRFASTRQYTPQRPPTVALQLSRDF